GYDISPVQDEVSGTEGQSVTLTCSYQTSSSYISLHWYRHKSGLAPQFILLKGAKGHNAAEFPKEKFDAQINDTSVPLKIQKLQPSDSALYYCAVKPTVTGNTQSLYKNLWRSLKTPMTAAMISLQSRLKSSVWKAAKLLCHTTTPKLLMVVIPSSGIDNILENHQNSS
uniref:Ig-like domain-containing protein n=1 Tax=Myripristis murdjan TaxID=586833 RepID=A0A667WPW5_9TELE